MGNYCYRKYVENKAVEFLLQYADSYPLNVFDLAPKVFEKILPYSAFPLNDSFKMIKASNDGFMYLEDSIYPWEDEHKILYYNDRQSPLRQKFTIMHDTGHAVIGHHQPSKLAEVEADYFAEYCLAPKVLINIAQLKSADEIQFVFRTSSPCAQTIWSHYIQWLSYRKVNKIFYSADEKTLIRKFYFQITSILNHQQILYLFEKRRSS